MNSKAPWIAGCCIAAIMGTVVFRLHSDGTTIYCAREYFSEVDIFVKRQRSIDPSIPKFEVSTLKDGLALLTIVDGGKSNNIKSTSFTKQVWCTKNQSWYFLQEVQREGDWKNWIAKWDRSNGFRKLMVEPGVVMGLSLSLDQKYLVAYTVSPNNGDPSEIFLIFLGDYSMSNIAIPAWLENPLMISTDRFFVRQHNGGSEGQVVQWTPGQTDPDSRSSDLKIGSNPILDITGLNGDVWGIVERRNGVSVVRIDPSLTKIVEDLGWIDP
jgi:hypothetical protein